MENGLIMGQINEYFRNIDIFNEVNSLIYIEELKIELLNELCKRMDEPIDLIDKPNSTNFGIGLQNLFTILFFFSFDVHSNYGIPTMPLLSIYMVRFVSL